MTPASGATGVGSGINPTITFSEPIAPATISTSTIELRNAANALVAGAVSYDAATRTREVRSGLGARALVDLYHRRQGRHERPARDGSRAAIAMASTFTSSFTTAAPVTCPCSIWDPASAVPAIADAGDGNAVELGVKFRADADGFITGVRYYKSAANTGTHVANLWTAAARCCRRRPSPAKLRAAGRRRRSRRRSRSPPIRSTSPRITRTPDTTR